MSPQLKHTTSICWTFHFHPAVSGHGGQESKHILLSVNGEVSVSNVVSRNQNIVHSAPCCHPWISLPSRQLNHNAVRIRRIPPCPPLATAFRNNIKYEEDIDACSHRLCCGGSWISTILHPIKCKTSMCDSHCPSFNHPTSRLWSSWWVYKLLYIANAFASAYLKLSFSVSQTWMRQKPRNLAYG